MNSKHQKKEINTTKDIITSLVKTINEKPDKLHADYTVSVHELIKYETAGIAAVLPLLNSPDKMERYRAQRVVEGVVQRKFGWKAGQGFPENSKGEEKMLALWQKNGNYSAEATEEERLAAIEKWKVWLTEKLNDGKEE